MFVQLAPASSDPRKLALFFRRILHVQSAISPFRPSICPSRRPEGNWLCLAHLSPAAAVPATLAADVSCDRYRPNWVRFAQLSLRGLGVPARHLSGAIGFVSRDRSRWARATSGEIGFVLCDSLRPIGFVCTTSPGEGGGPGDRSSISNPQSRSWVCFAHLPLVSPGAAGNWLRFARMFTAEKQAEAHLPGQLWGFGLWLGACPHVFSFRFQIVNHNS